MSSIPAPGRPVMPPGYGIRDADKNFIPWTHVDRQMADAHNYWICTTRPNGRPHAMPVWGVWVDTKFYFSSDRNSRKSRNLIEQPAVTVHLESGDDVVIIEGTAAECQDRQLLSTVDDAYHAKYGMRAADAPGTPATYAVTPQTVFAWREKDFPSSATRWLLGSS